MRAWSRAAVAVCLALGAAACSLAIGDTNLSQVRCTDLGHQGLPACAADQICLDYVCVDCASVWDACGQGQGGSSGEGGSGGDGGQDASAGTGGGTGGDQPDTSVGGSGGDQPETGPDALEEPVEDVVIDEGPKPLGVTGEECADNSECASGWCVDGIGPLAGKFCTALCCSTAADCPANWVCSSRGVHNLCVSSRQIGGGYANAGTVAVGGACPNGAGDCRSLMCNGAGKCTDMCCTNGNCKHDGSTYGCGYGSVNGAYIWTCQDAVSSKTDLSDCNGDPSTCDSKLCYTDALGDPCAGSCCTDMDCADMMQHGCDYGAVGSEVVRVCGFTADTKSCCKDSDCGGAPCRPVQEQYLTTSGYVTKWVLRCP